MSYFGTDDPPPGDGRSSAPRIPEVLEETLGDTLRDTYKRLAQGHEEYGDKSFEKKLSQLLDEVDEEILDQIGWSIIAREKIARLRRTVIQLEFTAQALERRATPIHYIHMPDGEVRKCDVLPSQWIDADVEKPEVGVRVLVCYSDPSVEAAGSQYSRTITTWTGEAWLGLRSVRVRWWTPLPTEPTS